MFLRDLNVVGANLTRYTNKGTGKTDTRINFPGIQGRMSIQIGDPDCVLKLIKTPSAYEGSDPSKPSMFLEVHDDATLNKLRELDDKILDLVTRSSDPEIQKMKPDRYSRMLKPPVPGKSEGKSISIKMNLGGKYACKLQKLVPSESDPDELEPVPATIADLDSEVVEQLYIGTAVSSLWMIRSDWGASLWANEVIIMPKEQTKSLVYAKNNNNSNNNNTTPDYEKKKEKEKERCIVLDTETTGLSPSKDRIIEIGAIELINGKRTSNTFNKYINPQVSLSKKITDLTGITDDILVDKPIFKDIVNEFLEWVGDSKIIAHNATFDMGFINSELGKIGLLPLKNEVLCTMLWYRSIFPGEKSSLDALRIKFGIAGERKKHGALLDASILVDVYNAMCLIS